MAVFYKHIQCNFKFLSKAIHTDFCCLIMYNIFFFSGYVYNKYLQFRILKQTKNYTFDFDKYLHYTHIKTNKHVYNLLDINLRITMNSFENLLSYYNYIYERKQ